jgi:membrane protein required for colicin V production
MSEMGITWVDVVVVAVLVASTGFAVWRGFIRETLSIISWALAAFATLYFGPLASSLLKGLMSEFLAYILGYLGVFLFVLIPLSFLTYRFSEEVHQSPVSALDRALGVAFGVVRGLAIIGFAYLIFTLIVPVRSQPSSVRNASTLDLMQRSSEVLLSIMPDHGNRRSSRAERNSNPAAETADKGHAGDAKPSARKKKTYGAKDRHALDKLIQATGSGGQ